MSKRDQSAPSMRWMLIAIAGAGGLGALIGVIGIAPLLQMNVGRFEARQHPQYASQADCWVFVDGQRIPLGPFHPSDDVIYAGSHFHEVAAMLAAPQVSRTPYWISRLRQGCQSALRSTPR